MLNGASRSIVTDRPTPTRPGGLRGPAERLSVEDVADTAHRADMGRVVRVGLDLLAQPPDVDLQGLPHLAGVIRDFGGKWGN